MSASLETSAAIAALASAIGLTAHLLSQRPSLRAVRALVPVAFIVCLGAVTDSLLVVAGAFMVWLGIPAIIAMIAMRRVSVRRDRQLVPVQPFGETRHTIDHLAAAWESIGFKRVGDFHLEPSSPGQSYHFLLGPDARELAFVGGVYRDRELVFHYDAIMSWSPTGSQWLTWNYPLPYGVRSAPELNLLRCVTADSPAVLAGQHREFLKLNDTETRPFPDLEASGAVEIVWATWLRRQLDYNLTLGWLALKNDGQDVGYTVRGLLGAARQFLAAYMTGAPRP